MIERRYNIQKEIAGDGPTPLYAHSLAGQPPEKWQTLAEHLNAVAGLAEEFARSFGAGEWARGAALLHDLGKILPAFQQKLFHANGLDYEGETADGQANHSGAGAAFAEEHYKMFGRALAYLIAGHHAGLPDYSSDKTGRAALKNRLDDAKKDLEKIRAKIGDYTSDEKLPALDKLPAFVTPQNFHLWTRMLFSCLVDADWLDTESVCSPEKSQTRQEIIFSSLAEMKEKFDAKLAEKIHGAAPSELNAIRAEILAQCRDAGKNGRAGLFTLTVPTGGGKTLASLAFALEHAMARGKSRVIYVIPYTGIIEQTVEEFRKYLGAENVIEHHSNIDDDRVNKESGADISARSEMAAENWNAPVIVTTNVQFFESLYSARPRRCRKLHNIANSVVILDEAQLITPNYLAPCVEALNQLAKNFRASLVLCTATQPALPKLDGVTEIIPPDKKTAYYQKLRRVNFHFPLDLNQRISLADVAARLQQHEKVLCVVNTRAECRRLYELVSEAAPEETLHLSALMCGEHRSQVIKKIKERLQGAAPLRVISTQVIEAGVDVDFPTVYRALAGLDSIVQTAGRCNREGKIFGGGDCHIFVPEKPAPRGLLRKGEDVTRELSAVGVVAPDEPESFARYFALFYASINDTGAALLDDLTMQADGGIYFRTVGDNFHLIDDDYTRPVIVRYGAAPELISRLEKGELTKEVFRRLQRYTVNVPRGKVEKLLAGGVVQPLRLHEKETDILIQYGENCYSEKFGIDLDNAQFSAEEMVI